MAEVTNFTHNDAAAAWGASEDRTPIFTVTKKNPARAEWDAQEVHGHDEVAPPETINVEYTMPKKPNVGFALKYLKEARVNADTAAVWLIETALGGEAYDALANELANEDDPDKALATFNAIATRIQQVALGGLDAPKA
jgi:hypothetical protein